MLTSMPGSPILKKPMTYTDIRFNGSLFAEGPYRQPPSPEVDQRWMDLGLNSTLTQPSINSSPQLSRSCSNQPFSHFLQFDLKWFPRTKARRLALHQIKPKDLTPKVAGFSLKSKLFIISTASMSSARISGSMPITTASGILVSGATPCLSFAITWAVSNSAELPPFIWLFREGFKYLESSETSEYVFISKDAPDLTFTDCPLADCIDILRQQIMCTADTGLFGQMWANTTSMRTFADFSTHHKCKNFDLVKEWAIEHESSEADVAMYMEGDLVIDRYP